MFTVDVKQQYNNILQLADREILTLRLTDNAENEVNLGIIRLPSGLDFLSASETDDKFYFSSVQDESYYVLSSGKNMNTFEIQLSASMARTPLEP